MTTEHAEPWDGNDWTTFRQALEDVTSLEHGLESDTGITSQTLEALRWRHWVVAFCARYAVRFAVSTGSNHINMVECGVADGVSAYFACDEATSQTARHPECTFTMHCYDSWAPMREDYLLPTENHHRGGYEGLSQERTRRNLRRFDDRIVYHAGYIPDSFAGKPPSPEHVSFLSIDLNSAKPTVSALEHFFPRLTGRSIVLFDDYGFDAYTDTKEAIDRFFADKDGAFLKLPTGQAIYFA